MLDRFLEEIDVADEVMRGKAAQGQGPSASALDQLEGAPLLEDLLSLYDQLIELLEFKEVLLAEQSDVWDSSGAACEDPKSIGLQLDRLRARRQFWEQVRTADPGPWSR
jgi:hypothetical protein